MLLEQAGFIPHYELLAFPERPRGVMLFGTQAGLNKLKASPPRTESLSLLVGAESHVFTCCLFCHWLAQHSCPDLQADPDFLLSPLPALTALTGP